MYCHRDKGQCLTPLKGSSIVVVLLGVGIYTAASHYKSQHTATPLALSPRASSLQESGGLSSRGSGSVIDKEMDALDASPLLADHHDQ